MKALQIKTNKRGIKYALVIDGNSYGVWKLCENYNGHVRGGIKKTWRQVERNITLEAATALFNRRGA